MFAKLNKKLGKDWYLSRGLWLGVLTGLIGSLELLREAVMTGDFSTTGIIAIVLGILKVWERVTRGL